MSEVPKIGDTIRLRAYKGATKDVVGQVVAVRDLAKENISGETWRRGLGLRSRYLITIQQKDGSYRSYYHGLALLELASHE